MGAEIDRYQPQLPADPAALEYSDLVALGRRLSSVSRWLLGDLAAHVETRYSEGRLQRYAADIEVAYPSLCRYRDVARAFPESATRVAHSWSVYRTLAGQHDRLKLVSGGPMTVQDARDILTGRQEAQRRAAGPMPPPPTVSENPARKPPRQGSKVALAAERDNLAGQLETERHARQVAEGRAEFAALQAAHAAPAPDRAADSALSRTQARTVALTAEAVARWSPPMQTALLRRLGCRCEAAPAQPPAPGTIAPNGRTAPQAGNHACAGTGVNAPTTGTRTATVRPAAS